MAAEYNKMGAKLMNEIIPMAQMMLLQNRENKKMITEFIESENAWNCVLNAKKMLK